MNEQLTICNRIGLLLCILSMFAMYHDTIMGDTIQAWIAKFVLAFIGVMMWCKNDL